MRNVSSERTEAAGSQKRAYADSRGVAYADVRRILGEDPYRWERVPKLMDKRVCECFHRIHAHCWNCGGWGCQAHHAAAGSAGKRDALPLLFALCETCHGAVNTPVLPLGRLLYLKYKNDWPNTDWLFTARAFKHHLPDLITKPR